jgi:ribosomal protein S12 methylthiotransferase
MRTKSVGKKKINIVTLGCSKNVYDSEVLMSQLKANGKEVEILLLLIPADL